MDNEHQDAVSITLGTVGTVSWTIHLLPQIYKNWSQKTTEGLCPWMLILWAIAAPFFGIYTTVRELNIPVQAQPRVFAFLTLIVVAQCFHYDRGWGVRKCFFVFMCTAVLLGCIEVAGVLSIRIPVTRGVDWPIILTGTIAIFLDLAGLIPPYIDIIKYNWEVRGFSFIFLIIDILGALLLLLSIGMLLSTECLTSRVFQRGPLDILAAVSYAGVLVMDLGIFGCHFVFLCKTWAQKRTEDLEDFSIPEGGKECSE